MNVEPAPMKSSAMRSCAGRNGGRTAHASVRDAEQDGGAEVVEERERTARRARSTQPAMRDGARGTGRATVVGATRGGVPRRRSSLDRGARHERSSDGAPEPRLRARGRSAGRGARCWSGPPTGSSRRGAAISSAPMRRARAAPPARRGRRPRRRRRRPATSVTSIIVMSIETAPTIGARLPRTSTCPRLPSCRERPSA